MTRNAPRHIALALTAAAGILGTATPLQAEWIHTPEPATTTFTCTGAEARKARLDDLQGEQRLAGAALVGIGVPDGIMPPNEWNPLDEGWISLRIAGGRAATGLFLLIEPLRWRTPRTETRVHPAEGAAARGVRHGRGSGAALSIAWQPRRAEPSLYRTTIHRSQ